MNPPDRYRPFLVEIRKRLLFVAVLFVISATFGFIYYERIIRIILKLFNFEGVNIVFTSPFQFIELAINSGIILGLVAVLPLLIFQVISFLKPAMSKSEYKITATLIPIAILLFIIGFGFGVFIMRYVVFLFYQRSVEFDIGNFLDISLLLSKTLITALFMGLAFQYPIALTLLIKFKVIKYRELAKQRMIAYSAALIFAAFLPPTDLLSLVLLTLPLVFLFEFTLLLNRHVLKTQIR